MTLDFKKLLKNALLKQLSIQHVQVPERNVQLFKREELAACAKVSAKMKELYGENSMLDGDYFIFFSNSGIDVSFDKEFVNKTLFKVVNSALGNSANDMRENELRMFTFDGAGQDTVVPSADIDDTSLTTAGADDANAGAVSDVMGTDDPDDTVSESVESPSEGEKFVFVKITMK